jgi:hypothetical protein
MNYQICDNDLQLKIRRIADKRQAVLVKRIHDGENGYFLRCRVLSCEKLEIYLTANAACAICEASS